MSRDKQDVDPDVVEDAESSEEIDNLEVYQEIVDVHDASCPAHLKSPGPGPEYSVGSPNPYLSPEVIALATDKETKRVDDRWQSGPSPADFGDHKPIPLDAVCANVVVLVDKEYENDLDDELEERLDNIIRKGHV